MAITLSCKACGNKWQGRAKVKGKRRCPECWSRQVFETSNEDLAGTRSAAKPSSTKLGRMTPGFKDALGPEPGDDEEILEKLKELKLARINKEIAEVESGLKECDAFSRLVARVKELIQSLGESASLDENMVVYLDSSCPWCGNGAMRHEKVKQGLWGWKCHDCGREAV